MAKPMGPAKGLSLFLGVVLALGLLGPASAANLIGPSFPDELAAAGLLGLPFSWGADGKLQFDPAMTPAQRAAVQAVLAVHDPTKPALPSQYQVNRTALLAKIDAALADPVVPQRVKDVLSALKALLLVQ